MLQGGFDDLAGEMTRLPDAQASDGIAGESDFDGPLSRFLAESGIHAALDDAEKGLGGVSSFGFRVSSIRARGWDVGVTRNLNLETRNLVPGHVMLVRFEMLLAALGPAQGQFHRLAYTGGNCGMFGALVESHDDVGAQPDLRIHRTFGREYMLRAIEMGAKSDAVFSDFAEFAQAEDLESAR